MPEPRQDAFQEIRYTIAGRIAEIQLNVPEKRNRLSFLMRREIVRALRLAESDDRVSIVLISGAGPSFCAGYDLAAPRPSAAHDGGEPNTGGPDGEAETEYYRQRGTRPDGWVASEHFDNWTDQFARSCVRDWLTIWDLLKPVIAMVQGHCVAGGTELMSMCDISFAADDARIGYPPMRGMTTPDVPYFAWKLSMAQAKYLQLTGNSVTGAEAAQMGWISKSFAADKLREETMRELEPMSHIAPALLSANKQQVNQAYELMGMRTHLQNSWQYHVLSGAIRPGADRFGSILRSEGLHAALEWRDGQFRAAGLA
jgi:enoyl-CoA hydratase